MPFRGPKGLHGTYFRGNWKKSVRYWEKFGEWEESDPVGKKTAKGNGDAGAGKAFR